MLVQNCVWSEGKNSSKFAKRCVLTATMWFLFGRKNSVKIFYAYLDNFEMQRFLKTNPTHNSALLFANKNIFLFSFSLLAMSPPNYVNSFQNLIIPRCLLSQQLKFGGGFFQWREIFGWFAKFLSYQVWVFVIKKLPKHCCWLELKLPSIPPKLQMF